MVEKFYKSRILPSRVSFTCGGQNEDIFLKTQKWKEFITINPVLQEMAKEIFSDTVLT